MRIIKREWGKSYKEELIDSKNKVKREERGNKLHAQFCSLHVILCMDNCRSGEEEALGKDGDSQGWGENLDPLLLAG